MVKFMTYIVNYKNLLALLANVDPTIQNEYGEHRFHKYF